MFSPVFANHANLIVSRFRAGRCALEQTKVLIELVSNVANQACILSNANLFVRTEPSVSGGTLRLFN